LGQRRRISARASCLSRAARCLWAAAAKAVAVRRVHEPAPALTPAPPPGGLHLPQGPARQVYAMISKSYNAAAGCKLHSAAAIAYASAGEFVGFNPVQSLRSRYCQGVCRRQTPPPSRHRAGRRIRSLRPIRAHPPAEPCRTRSGLSGLHGGLLPQVPAHKPAAGPQHDAVGPLAVSASTHSVRIPAGSSRTREALSQYIARAPVSLSKLIVEDHAATVLYQTDLQPLLPHQPQDLPCHGLHRPVAAAPARPSPPTDPPLRTVLLPLPRYMVPSAALGPPRCRGVAA